MVGIFTKIFEMLVLDIRLHAPLWARPQGNGWQRNTANETWVQISAVTLTRDFLFLSLFPS